MQEQQKHLVTQDGTRLFYRYHPAADGSIDKAIVLFHRGHEHSDQTMFVANELGFDNFAYFAWNARSHDHSPGERSDGPSVGASIVDVDDFIRYIQSGCGIKSENICVITQNIGTVLVSTWLHDYALRIHCAVLASSTFKVKLHAPFARTGLEIMQKWRGDFFVNSYVKAHYLTRSQERQTDYDNDSLITRAISVHILLGLYEAAERVVVDAQAVTTPVQLLISGNGQVVHHRPQHDFYNRLGSHIKERHILPGFYHDTLGGQNREVTFVEMRRSIRERFNQPLYQVDLAQAYLHSESHRGADELTTPLSICPPCGAFWVIYHAPLDLGTRWSEGLKIGKETSYDSGSTLDYVYRNRPQGSNAFSVTMNKHYLNTIGWRSIHQCKINIGKAIWMASAKLHKTGKPVHVLDIASGHGRYVPGVLTVDALSDFMRLRDYSPINVEAGRKLIAEHGLRDTIISDEVDVYDRASYQDFQLRPTLDIVSSLHESFADNDLISNSLYGFGDTIETGGYLTYTEQPWRPQLEMIARALTGHKADSPDQVIRRRNQQEMDQLVGEASFEKIHQWIDEDDILAVSLAVEK